MSAPAAAAAAVSKLTPEQLRAQLTFWQRYGRLLMSAAALGAASGLGALLWRRLFPSSSSRRSAAPGSGAGAGAGAAAGGAAAATTTTLALPYRDSSTARALRAGEPTKLSLAQLDWAGKRVLLRTDYNVVVTPDGAIEDTIRVDQSLPTIRALLAGRGGLPGAHCVVIVTHLGRPAGAFDRADFSLAPLVPYLQQCLGPRTPVEFLPDCVGAEAEARTRACAPGTVFLCENLRFHVEEIGSGVDRDGKEVRAAPARIRAFCAALSRMGDVFVFEAYGAAHRAHASIVGVDLPQRAMGLGLEQELRVYGHLLAPRTDKAVYSNTPAADAVAALAAAAAAAAAGAPADAAAAALAAAASPRGPSGGAVSVSEPDCATVAAAVTAAAAERGAPAVVAALQSRVGPRGPVAVVVGSAMKVTDKIQVRHSKAKQRRTEYDSWSFDFCLFTHILRYLPAFSRNIFFLHFSKPQLTPHSPMFPSPFIFSCVLSAVISRRSWSV